jgi:hypothetical protein
MFGLLEWLIIWVCYEMILMDNKENETKQRIIKEIK